MTNDDLRYALKTVLFPNDFASEDGAELLLDGLKELCTEMDRTLGEDEHGRSEALPKLTARAWAIVAFAQAHGVGQ